MNVTVKVGAKQKIKTSVKPKKATLKKLTFKSSAKKIAKVNAKGVITGVKAGKAKITVKAVDGSKKKATVSVVVTAGAVATSPAITTGPAVTAKVAPSATVAPTTNVPTTNAPTTNAPATNAPATTAPALTPVEVPELADGESYKVTFGKDTLNVSKDDIEAVASAFNQKADKIKANLAKDLAEKANNFIAKAYDSKTASVAVKGLTYSKEAGSDTVYVEKNGKKVAVKTTVKDDVVSVAATGDKNFSLDVKGSAKECTVSNVVIGGEKFEGTFAVATEISDDNTVTITVADTAKLVVDKNGNIKELSVAKKYAQDLKISK